LTYKGKGDVYLLFSTLAYKGKGDILLGTILFSAIDVIPINMVWIYNEWVTLKQQVNPKNYSRTVQESQE